jgi:hypothetical protein
MSEIKPDIIQSFNKIGCKCSNNGYHLYDIKKWLREERNIHLWVYYCMILESNFYQIRHEISKNEYHHFTNENDSNKMNEFTYEEALEAGIWEAYYLLNN